MTFSFPDSSVGKESTCNARDLGLIPGLGRSPEERKDYPLWYSGLENSWGRKDKINRKKQQDSRYTVIKVITCEWSKDFTKKQIVSR